MMRWPAGGIVGGEEYSELLSNVDFLPTILEMVRARIPDTVQGRSFLSLLRKRSFEKRNEIFAEKTYHTIYDPMRCIRTERDKYIRNFSDGPLTILPCPGIRDSDGKTLTYLLEPYQTIGSVDLGNIPSGQRWHSFFLRAHPVEELYGLETDPYEQNNLVDRSGFREIQKELSSHLAKWMEETRDPILKGPVPLQNE